MTFEEIQQRLRTRNIILLSVDFKAKTWQSRMNLKCEKCNHGWNADLHGVIYHGRGCPHCAKIDRIKRITAHKKSGHEIDDMVNDINSSIKRQGPYQNMQTKIAWECLNCQFIWNKTPSDIIHNRHGCPRCSKRERLTNEVIDQRLLNQNKKFKRISDSQGSMQKIKWECLNCDRVWLARPNDIFSVHQSGCPYCSKQPYSKMAIKWLEEIRLKTNKCIIHAENGGEYVIPGTRYRADGFCKETNTIYEFYGDRFHGNPKLFSDNEACHPYDSKITAKQLYQRTIKREKELKEEGYCIVMIWETDWKNK